jgi:hypothetical protein
VFVSRAGTFEQSTSGDERSRSGGFSVLNLNGCLINQACVCLLFETRVAAKERNDERAWWMDCRAFVLPLW